MSLTYYDEKKFVETIGNDFERIVRDLMKKPLNIVYTDQLPRNEYIANEHKKTSVGFHHTVSELGKFVDDYFASDRGKSQVAVPFVLDKDGLIYFLFDPKFYAWHLASGDGGAKDKSSIGIEVVNEGYLNNLGKTWFDGKYVYRGVPVKLPKPWRQQQYFASYTIEQVLGLIHLTFWIFNNFKDIPRKYLDSFDYSWNYVSFLGCFNHCNVNAGKTDMSPAFPVKWLKLAIEMYEEFEKEKSRHIELEPVQPAPIYRKTPVGSIVLESAYVDKFNIPAATGLAGVKKLED